MCVRVARNIAEETESIKRDDINMRPDAEGRQGLRQRTAGMCHTAYRQYPAIRCDALCLYGDTVGSGQLFWCLENRFRKPTGTGAGKGETFFQVLVSVSYGKHLEMMSPGVAFTNSLTIKNAALPSIGYLQQQVLGESVSTRYRAGTSKAPALPTSAETQECLVLAGFQSYTMCLYKRLVKG